MCVHDTHGYYHGPINLFQLQRCVRVLRNIINSSFMCGYCVSKRALYISRAIKEHNVFIAVLPCTHHKNKTSKHPPKATVLLDNKYIDVEMFDVNPLVINKMLNVIVFRVKDKVYCFAHHSVHDKLPKSIYNKAIMIRGGIK